jgi:hypothetical protein
VHKQEISIQICVIPVNNCLERVFVEKVQQRRILQIGNLLIPFISGVGVFISSLGEGDFTDVFTTDEFPKLFSPAPITFAIWGPIFFFLALFYIYQSRGIFDKEERPDLDFVLEVNVFFILSTIATTAWYVLWAGGFVWPAAISMALYLVTILGAYLGLKINKKERSLKEHVYITVGWSMYAGWITAATFVNVTTAVVSSGFDPAPLGEANWTIIVLLIALVIYLMVLVTRNDFIFASVGLWAIIGIIIERTNPAFPPQPEIVLVSILGAIILSVAMLLWAIIQSRRGNITIFSKFKS